MNSKNLSKLLLLIALGSGLPACAWIDEVGKDKSYATIEISDTVSGLDSDLQCVADKLPIEFWDFGSDEPFDGFARLHFFETLSNTISGNYMEIRFMDRDSETLETCPKVSDYEGTTFELTRNGCVRATLQVNRCDPRISAQILGEMTLDSYSVQRRDWVSGTFNGKLVYFHQVTSSTETEEVSMNIANVSGKFAFVNHAGPIWER